MGVVAISSAKGSPGVTTLCFALALARPAERRCLIVEADPDGGSLAARLELGYEPGLVELAAAARREAPDPATIRRFTQPINPGVSVIPAPASSEQATAALTSSGPAMARGLGAISDTDCIVDLGRVSARSASLELARRAAVTVLLTRPTLDDVQYLPSRVETLRRTGSHVELVCVGARPYDPAEIADHLGVPLFGVWADDREATDSLWRASLSSRRLRRSLWWRSTADLALRLAARLAPVHGLDTDDQHLSPEVPTSSGLIETS